MEAGKEAVFRTFLRFIVNCFTGRKRKPAIMVSFTVLTLCLFALYKCSMPKEVYEPKEEWLARQDERNKRISFLMSRSKWGKLGPKLGSKLDPKLGGKLDPKLVLKSTKSPVVEKKDSIFIPASPSVDCTSMPQSSYLFCKTGADPMQRAMDLANRLTTMELIYQTSTIAPAITHLGIKDYNWRSNCLHGWSKSGGNWGNDLQWTVFPAPIGLAATFDTDLIRIIGGITGTEGRALHNEMLVKFKGSSTEAAGLNCFSPNVNLFRDPRWGRGQETFGEDPLLISAMGIGYTRGLQQGPDKNYLLVAACAKHFAVHSGPETVRFQFVANVSMHDLYATYLPAFKSQVMGAKVSQMMPAYTGLRCSKQLNGAPDVANPFLLKSVLRDEFGAPNISICSDNGALDAVVEYMHYVNSFISAAAVSMNASTDLDLGHDLVYTNYLSLSLDQGIVTLDSIRQAVTRSFYLRMLVGDFDPPSKVPYQSINKSSLDTESSRKINLIAARESIVLLKNEMYGLPIDRDRIKHLVVLGPNANNSRAMLSNYEGIPSQNVTVLQGIKKYLENSTVKVDYAEGCDGVLCNNKYSYKYTEKMVGMADYVIMVMGMMDGVTEGEGFDRVQTTCDGLQVPLLGLPGCQKDFVESIVKLNAHVILVLLNGGPLSIPDLYRDRGVVGIIEAFYPGALGGTAIADVLFGAYSPSGKMPVSVYESEHDLPPFEDYNMNSLPGRTYRYSTKEPLFQFGFGMSYAIFKYTNLVLSKTEVTPCDNLEVTVTLQNLSPRVTGDEIVQIYLVPHATQIPTGIAPIIQLVGFKRISFSPGDVRSALFEINPYLMSFVDASGVHNIYPGTYEVQVGSNDINDMSTAFTINSGSGDAVKTSTCSNSPLCLACGG